MINKDNDYNKDENRDDDNGNQVFPPGSKHGVADNKVHRRGRCNTIVYGTIKPWDSIRSASISMFWCMSDFGKLLQIQLRCETLEN